MQDRRWSLVVVMAVAVGLLAFVGVAARSGVPRLVAVHAVPDGGAEVPGLAAAASRELAVVDEWFAAQHPGADGLRWKRDAAGAIAVEVVELPLTAEQAGDAFRLGGALRDADVATGSDVLVVYTDIATPTCGTTTFDAFDRAAAVLWLASCRTYPSTDTTAVPQGATVVAAHELAHVLGGVPECAPNVAGRGHVDDDPRDILYAGAVQDTDELLLDPGNDDYFLAFRSGCPDAASHGLWLR